MRNKETAIRVVSPYSRGLKKALAYFLVLKKISLISSLKSAINTETSATNRFKMSIMDSLQVKIHPLTQPNNQKKSSAFLYEAELNLTCKVLQTFFRFHLPNGWINYNIKKDINE